MNCNEKNTNKRKFEELEAEIDELRRTIALPNVKIALLGEKLMDVIGIVAAGRGRRFGAGFGGLPSQGFAADVSHCLNLCKLTRNIVQRSDVADMLTQSLRLQCGEREAHAAKREDFSIVRMAKHPDQDVGYIYIAMSTTQLIRAALLNNLPRVLQLVQLGAPLNLVEDYGNSALHWACTEGYEHVAKALLAGKFEGKGATVELRNRCGRTALGLACLKGREVLVRLLIEKGASQLFQDDEGDAALHLAVDQEDNVGIVALLLAAPGAAAALVLKNNEGHTALSIAIDLGQTACAAALRAAGATA